jgi:hypothetical protein
MKNITKAQKNALIIAGSIIGVLLLYKLFKKPTKPVKPTNTSSSGSSDISDPALLSYFNSLPQDVQMKINTIVANGKGEKATKEYLTKQYKDGYYMFIERWYAGVNRRIQKSTEGTVFIYGNRLYDSYYGKQRNNVDIFNPEYAYKAVTLSENATMSLESTKSSSQTSTIVKGTYLGDITNAFYNLSEDTLFYYIAMPTGANGIFKFVWAGYIKVQEFKGKTLIRETNGLVQ